VPTPTPIPQDHITVHVHDGSSAPVEGATVTAGGQTAGTDASGNAYFTFDRGTLLTIHVSATGFTDSDTPYTTGGDATVDVTLA
jgi:Carboxypeptidase regulatory-like domain